MLYFAIVTSKTQNYWIALKECSSLEEGQEMVTKLMPRLDTRDINCTRNSRRDMRSNT